MKRKIRNLLALTLTAQMIFSLTACGSKKSDANGNSSAGNGSGTTSGSSADANTDTGSGSITNTSAKGARIVADTDLYYNVDIGSLKASFSQDKEIQYSDIPYHYIVGDRIVAAVDVVYKKPEAVEKEQEKLNLDDDKQLERYMQIDNEYQEHSLQIFDLKGELVARVPIDDNCSFSGAYAGKDGEILVVTTKMDMNVCRAKPLVTVYSASGEKLRDIDLQVKDSLEDVALYVLENGNLLLASIGKFWILDGNGQVLFEETNPDLNGTMLHSGGKWFAVMPKYTADGMDVNVQEVDINTGKLVDKPFKSDGCVLNTRQGDQDCFILNANGIEKFDIATQTKTQVLAWKDTDVNSGLLQLEGARISSENDMVFFQFDALDEGGRSSMDVKKRGASLISVVHLTKADKNPHAGKVRLRLGMNGDISNTFLQQVLNYNKDPQNPTRIELIDYTADAENAVTYEKREEGLLASTNQLVMDMLAGNGPDILVGYSELSQFNSDTMLVDLNQYINSDSTINRDEIYDNILRSFEEDGKLYTMPLTYTLEGMAVNTSFNGAKANWTFAEFDQMASSLSSDVQPIKSDDPSTLLKQWMQSLSSHFIDNQNKTVDFESEEFRTLLETVKKYGKSSGDDDKNRPLGDKFNMMMDAYAFRDNLVASCYTDIADLSAYASITREKSGHTVALSGVPSLNGMGMTAVGQLSMAITTSCADPDIAWQFIRTFLNEDIQKDLSFNTDTLPINKNAFKRNCQEEIEVNKEYIEDLKKDASKISPDVLADMIELTQQHADSMDALISSVSASQSWDNDVMNIILEEAAGFFAGQRSVDDVCKNIQNRASIVVQER